LNPFGHDDSIVVTDDPTARRLMAGWHNGSAFTEDGQERSARVAGTVARSRSEVAVRSPQAREKTLTPGQVTDLAGHRRATSSQRDSATGVSFATQSPQCERERDSRVAMRTRT
jgi:hypothetical protein